MVTADKKLSRVPPTCDQFRADCAQFLKKRDRVWEIRDRF